jgi:AAA+ superfamily predicted ATPase
MDNLGPLKAQIMTMFMMKKPNDKSNGNDDIFMVVYTMLFMNFVEYVFKHMPQVIELVKTFAITYILKKKKELINPLIVTPSINKITKKEEVTYSITLQRHFYKNGSSKTAANNNNNMDKIDAVIDYLCSLNNVTNVKMGSRYSLNCDTEIELTPLLKAKVKETGNLEGDEDGLIEILIYSTVLNIPGIREWIEEVYNNYTFEKNNKLGNGIYYFNEIPIEPPSSPHPTLKNELVYRWDNAPKMLTFRMTEFKTSKSFNNIYGTHIAEMKERLDLFINHPDWYIERGIPHSLGILLHGVPGGGKTSTIKAISKDTNRHIFNLSLRKFTSQQQLTNLFFNDTVSIFNEGNKQTLKIPLNKRVYVIEDIDCLTDVVLDRELYKQKNTNDGDAITLSFLLNLLDGVLETPGRILVITSNYPERLDKAFIRPGRIDVKIEFTYTNRVFILDMINKFYSIKYTIDTIPEELDNIFTPAEIMECMCTYFKQPLESIELMKRKLLIKEQEREKREQQREQREQQREEEQQHHRVFLEGKAQQREYLDNNIEDNKTDPKEEDKEDLQNNIEHIEKIKIMSEESNKKRINETLEELKKKDEEDKKTLVPPHYDAYPRLSLKEKLEEIDKKNFTQTEKEVKKLELTRTNFESKDTFPIMGNDTNDNDFASYESAFEEPVFNYNND